MKTKKVLSIIGISMVLLFIVGIAIYNIVVNKTDFLDASIYQVLSLLFAITITYLLTQKKNDERRKNDMLDKMILGIQKDISEKSLVRYETEEEQTIALLQQKSLANRLEYLKDKKTCADIADEVDYISREMEHLREFYGSHMKDKDYMEKSSADIEKYIVNITDKCFYIRLKLYDN